MGEKTFQKQRCSSPFTIDVSDELWLEETNTALSPISISPEISQPSRFGWKRPAYQLSQRLGRRQYYHLFVNREALQCISSIVHEHPYYNAYCCSVLCATTTFVLEKQNDLESRLQTGVNLNFAILQFVWKATDDLSNIIEQAV